MYRLLLLLIILNNTAIAQKVSLIRVVDSKTNQPLDYVSISIAQKSFLTNDFGEAFVSNISKNDTMHVSCIGYSSQSIPFSQFNDMIQIRLSRKNFDLNEIQIMAYTDTKLAEIMLTAFKNTQKKIGQFSVEMRTYSFKEQHDPVEYMEGLYNVTCKNGFIEDATLKIGNVLFPKEDLQSNFLSVGITKLFKLTNPYSKLNIYFKSPYKLSSQKILNAFTLKQSNQGQHLIRIDYNSKDSKSNGYVIVDMLKKEIIEFKDKWIFTENYPLVSINSTSKLTDTLTITATTNIKQKFNYQRISCSFKYNNKHISTTSLFTYKDSALLNLPFNYQSFNNDYSDILSIPRIDKKTSSTLFEVNSQSNIQRLFSEAILEEILIDKNDASPDFILELTGLGFYEENWTLNWSKLPTAKIEQQLNTQIRTFIYADIIQLNDSFVLIAEPVFDYFNSTYNYDRNESNAIYISNFMYLTKIEAEKLKAVLLNEMKKENKNSLSNKRFMELCSLHEKNLKKLLFKYKLETNGGNNLSAMEKWNSYIIQELNP